jgi:hypothetical protein
LLLALTNRLFKKKVAKDTVKVSNGSLRDSWTTKSASAVTTHYHSFGILKKNKNKDNDLHLIAFYWVNHV